MASVPVSGCWLLQLLGRLLSWLLTGLRALRVVRLPLWQEEEVPVVSEQIDLSAMTVEDTYTGPRMQGEPSVSPWLFVKGSDMLPFHVKINVNWAPQCSFQWR